MNEHTWEKLDADMRSEMSEQYIQERCPHEELYAYNIKVKIQYIEAFPLTQSKPVGDLDTWKKYLANTGTDLFEMYAEVVCDKCGATQEQYIDIDTILGIENIDWTWEE